MGAKRKPLRPEEVPETLRKYVDFGSQRMVGVHNSIDVICPICGRRRVKCTSDLRRKNRRCTPYCINHSAGANTSNANPLNEKELPEELRQYLDFAGQWIENGRTWINVRCPGCGDNRVLRSHVVRAQAKKGSWTALCWPCHRKGMYQKHWKGGRKIDNDYVLRHKDTFTKREQIILQSMFTKKGYVPEHRAIFALALGRPLKDWRIEQVHHINTETTDNRPKNLQLVDHHKRPICPKCPYGGDVDITNCASCGA